MKDTQIQKLLTVVIQIQDVDNALGSLHAAGVVGLPMSSFGSFLRRQNVTLFIAVNASRLDEVIGILEKTCHRRIEYISPPLEGVPANLAISTPVSVGGATIFTMDLDYFEELS